MRILEIHNRSFRNFKELGLNHPLKGHIPVPTNDGSQTLFSERFQENCHSTHGAVNETHVHYIQGCKLAEKLETRDTLKILEVGLGAGVGLTETIKFFSRFPHSQLHFVTLELDEELVDYLRDQYKHDAYFEQLKKSEWGYQAVFKNIKIDIIIGDARFVLKNWTDQYPHFKFDCIYQDAFSPKKNPHLWTVEWFNQLKQISAGDCILSTYSSSVSIKKSLVEAGWSIYPGEQFGPKRSSTRATLNGNSDPDLLKQLQASSVQAIRDRDVYNK